MENTKNRKHAGYVDKCSTTELYIIHQLKFSVFAMCHSVDDFPARIILFAVVLVAFFSFFRCLFVVLSLHQHCVCAWCAHCQNATNYTTYSDTTDQFHTNLKPSKSVALCGAHLYKRKKLRCDISRQSVAESKMNRFGRTHTALAPSLPETTAWIYT